ncbi:Transcriptional regulator, LacI family [Alteracholeplasma palmae J233]|uniref:Transcriptional regulator, LacI family n=1 Tax=Alteracholeplasma palmae (strain ATCC 49389 / J233) TaxID=1318466 RepID=U4KPM7_ALTPJ|nr:LacI family DNA-binding transcriptional regulator [Alteracholeplasma palmae]CCV64220.1 Transcriptional regulator, LacI family [Alteracholeplasma palmae J233]
MSITMKEIAVLAGVSQGTVDRVFHDRGGVSKKTKEKILRIAKENNYQHNIYARALVNSNKKYKIGIVLNSIGNDFFINVIKGIKEAALKHQNDGIEIIIEEMKGYNPLSQIKLIDKLLDKTIDSLILTPINDPLIIDYLDKLEVPLITLNSDIDVRKIAFIGCDYYQNGQMAGDLALLLKDAKNILIVTGNVKQDGHKSRIEGFKERLEGKDIEIDILENQDDNLESYKIVKNHLEKNKVDLVYFNAGGIKGGIKAIKESNQNPEIITVDETVEVINAVKDKTVLATISQQPFKQGFKSVDTMVKYLLFHIKPNNRELYIENSIKSYSSKFEEEAE